MTRKDILFTRYEIENRVHALAKDLAVDYRGKTLTLIAVLNGGVMIAADLLRSLWDIGFDDVLFDSIKVSSYGQAFESSGEPVILKDIRLDITGQHVVIVEDIVDTGLTLQAMRQYMLAKNPASFEILSLLAKPESIRRVPVVVKYLGFEIDNVWVEGYGIDSAEKGRGNPNIMQVIQPEN